jgi:hypothetical protein
MSFRTSIRIVTAIGLTIGVVCQFIQHTDPVFPFAYFTVDSATLAALIATTGLRGRSEPPGIAFTRGAAATGVILSGIVYAAVIAPASPTGGWFQPSDDYWVRTATVLMHGAGPLLVTADFLAHPYPFKPSWRTAAKWSGWPVGYLAVMLTLQGAGVTEIPYRFLQPAATGGDPGVLAVTLGIAAMFIVLGRALQELRSRMQRPRNASSFRDG